MNDLETFDRQFSAQGFRYIFGVDEAGRGPLAGPVVAAAVCLKTTDFSLVIRDSKKMTASQRMRAFEEIFHQAYVGIGIMNEEVIDARNILQATFLAMCSAVRQAVSRLVQSGCPLDHDRNMACLLIDGNRFQTDLPYPYRTIVGGDSRSLSVACASIIAKVTRDRILEAYDQVFPQYGFSKHKGYATLAHRRALEEHGAVFVHRKTFRTVRKAVRL